VNPVNGEKLPIWTADYVLLRFAATKPRPGEDGLWDSRCAGA